MTSYLDLDDFVETAAELLALPEETVVKMARLELAESALHAPQAGWGEVEFYPDFAMKAAVLLVRLAKNHATSRRPPTTRATGEETFQRMRAIAARRPRTWKRSRPRSPGGSPNGCARVPRMVD